MSCNRFLNYFFLLHPDILMRIQNTMLSDQYNQKQVIISMQSTSYQVVPIININAINFLSNGQYHQYQVRILK